jgi:hypothetical protein
VKVAEAEIDISAIIDPEKRPGYRVRHPEGGN